MATRCLAFQSLAVVLCLPLRFHVPQIQLGAIGHHCLPPTMGAHMQGWWHKPTVWGLVAFVRLGDIVYYFMAWC